MDLTPVELVEAGLDAVGGTDAPADLGRGSKDLAGLPPKMRRDLAELGLL